MATTPDFIEFVCEQMPDSYAVRARKMFGEYMVYADDKPILLVCDNCVYVKKLAELQPLLGGVACGVPYPGAKEHYVLDVEDACLVKSVIPLLVQITPLPKSKR